VPPGGPEKTVSVGQAREKGGEEAPCWSSE
jgi:hypothetical protein